MHLHREPDGFTHVPTDRISIEFPSNPRHTRGQPSVRRVCVRIESPLANCRQPPPPESPLRPFPPPHTHIPLPPDKPYSPRTSVPPHAAHASPTSASSRCVARHARHVFVGAFVGAVRNVAAHTRPGRSSAGVAAAYLAGPNGVRPAAAAAAHRRVTSAEGGRFRRPVAADASSPLRASSRFAATASAPEAHATCPARMFHTAANRRMVARCLTSRGSAARCLATREISAAAARLFALGFDHASEDDADAGPGVV